MSGFVDKIKSHLHHEPRSDTVDSDAVPAKATAKVNGVVLAETDNYEFVEGNVYFPPSSIKREYFSASSLHTNCPWKGQSSYYDINVNGMLLTPAHLIIPDHATDLIPIQGKELKDAAWYYPAPFEKAARIKDFVAFDKRKVDEIAKA
ncbi:MAG: hypothetical protein M1821_000054 [Bathelium mastoideum]|nr:MAG: hypothetical protein M1821_000054 [Bathelium mastoideum]KAI9687914.1 MAG: hypothetical protein M1822_001996 [Bathelium mastoideum]